MSGKHPYQATDVLSTEMFTGCLIGLQDTMKE